MSENMEESNESLENEIERNQKEFIGTFNKILDDELPGWTKKIQARESTILCIGFGGTATEFVPLYKQFPKAKLFGIDPAPEALTKQDIEVQIGKEMPLILKTADAGKENSYQDATGKPLSTDLTVIRSPNILSSPTEWASVFKEAWNHLSTDGVMYITTKDKIEARTTKEILEKQGITVSEPIENPTPHTNTAYFPETFILLLHKQT